MDIVLKVMQFVQQNKALVGLTGGVILGLLLGLAIGWWWWPVEWTSTTPANLRSDFRDDYLVWVANQYSETGDLVWAQGKVGVEFWKPDQLSQALEDLAQARGGEEAVRLRALAQALEEAPEEPTEQVGLWARLRPVAMVCGVAILVTAIVGGVLLLITRARSAQVEAPGAVGVAERFPAAEEVSWGAEGPPLAQFPTTYTLGDDHYDPSFSVELESGEFMGECGVGVSETVGVGAPNKVTAFEIWLFDKSDIRTVTKVLMSDYAFHDEALRAKLAPKGEPVLAEEGKDIILETKTLRVRARVLEVEYGEGNLPPDSFFERLTVDLAAWVKPVQGGEEPTPPSPEFDEPSMPPTL